MSKPVNLNRFRKDKARADAKVRADQNVVRFGRSKAEKERAAKLEARTQKTLDNHRTDE